MISINEGNQLDAPSHIVLLYLNVECQYQTVIKSITAPSNNITCLLWVLRLQLLTVLLFLLVIVVIGDINSNNFTGSVVTEELPTTLPEIFPHIWPRSWSHSWSWILSFSQPSLVGLVWLFLLMHCTLSSRFSSLFYFFFLPFFFI